MLGGAIRTPNAWTRERLEFVENFEYYNIIKSWKVGINHVEPETARFTGSLAYHLPPSCAKILVELVDAGKRRPPDIMLNMVAGVLNGSDVYYPNPYAEHPQSRSQCGSPSRDLLADYFLTSYMQNHARMNKLQLPPIPPMAVSMAGSGTGSGTGSDSSASVVTPAVSEPIFDLFSDIEGLLLLESFLFMLCFLICLLIHGRNEEVVKSKGLGGLIPHFIIFVKTIEGKTISVDVSPCTVVSDLLQHVADKMGPRLKARLSYRSIQLDDCRWLADYNIQKDATLFEDGRVRGGMPKVIKTIVKSKAVEKVAAADEHIFSNAFKTAANISSSSSFDIGTALATMNVDSLSSLKEFLSHRVGNTPNHRMMQRVYEHMDFYKNLTVAQEKLNSTMQHFKDLVQADIDENFTDDGGKVEMDKMKEMVSNLLAVKKNSAMG